MYSTHSSKSFLSTLTSSISTEIGIQPLLVGGELGGKDRWLHFLADNTRASQDFGPRITLATVASAASEAFTTRLQISNSLLVVADEVHTLGQSQCHAL